MGITAAEVAFGRNTLMGLVQAFVDREPTPIKDIYKMEGRSRQGLLGDTVSFDREDFGREMAPVSSLENPSVRVFKENPQVEYHPWIEVAIHEFIPAKKVWLDNRALGSVDGDAASQEIDNAMERLFKRMNLQMEYACAQHLVSATGLNSANIPNSTVIFTKDFGTRDFTVGASWATAGTKIRSGALEIPAIEDLLSNNEGKQVGTFLYNRKTSGYFVANTEIGEWYKTTAQGIQLFNSRNFNGLAGIPNWRQMDHGLTRNGTFEKFVPDDVFVALPSTLDDVLGLAEGQVMVPADQFVTTAPSAASIVRVNGPALYATLETDPIGIKIHLVHRYLPVLFRPTAIVLCADVTAP